MNLQNSNKPDVVMFVDDAFAHGVEKGHYNKMYKPTHGLTITGLSQANMFKVNPTENQIYYFDRYQNKYIAQSEDMHLEFLESKMLCYQNALIYMGAKSFNGEVTSSRKRKIVTRFNSTAAYKVVRGKLKIDSEEEKNIRNSVKLKTTFEEKNKMSNDQIQKYINTFGLSDDKHINSIFHLYKMQDGLFGMHHEVEIKMLEELNKSIDIALGLDVAEIFTIDSTFKKIQTERLDVDFKIEVQF